MTRARLGVARVPSPGRRKRPISACERKGAANRDFIDDACALPQSLLCAGVADGEGALWHRGRYLVARSRSCRTDRWRCLPPHSNAHKHNPTPPCHPTTALPQHPNTAPLAHMSTSVHERGWHTAHIRWGRQPDIACFDLRYTWPSIYSRAPGPSPLHLPPMRVQSRHQISAP